MTCRIFECARLHGSVQVPPSQDEALWALLMAALGRGPCLVRGLRPPLPRAVGRMAEALQALGARVVEEGEGLRVEPAGPEGSPQEEQEEPAGIFWAPEPLWPLLVPALWVRGRKAVLLLEQEPQAAALEALQGLCGPQGPCSVQMGKPRKEGPGGPQGLEMEVSGRLPAGDYQLEGSLAGALLPGLMIALSFARDAQGKAAASRLMVSGPVAQPALAERALGMMERFGRSYEREGGAFTLLPSREPGPAQAEVSGDWTVGSALLCANALGGGVRVENLRAGARIVALLGEMGLSLLGSREEWYVTSPSRARLLPLRAPCGELPEALPFVALLCTQAWGESLLSGLEGMREDGLLASTVAFLTRMGAKARLSPEGDALVIQGPMPLKGGFQVEAAGEPRLALLAALGALAAGEPIAVSGAEVVEEAWPGFWALYRALGGRVS